MTRGLLWLPLLIVFIWLAWAGWNEYQKLEAYRAWAEQFERAKYDIYAVLGQQGNTLTWGKPTRKGPVSLQTVSLDHVQAIRLLVDNQLADLNQPPEKGRTIELELDLPAPATAVRIPFTDVALAARWGNYLQQNWPRSQSLSA